VGAAFTRHLKVARSLLGRFPELPLIYEAHEVFADTAGTPAIADLERTVLERAAAVVANSRATAVRLSERHSIEKQIHVIPNGVEYPLSVPAKDWSRAREHVVYAGSFFDWKGVDDLVLAAGELDGFHICIIGGDEHGIRRLRALQNRSGATVKFAGRIAHDEVLEALQHACIAILPNRAGIDSSFTSPIKLFEYMAAGCAVVASNVPALREVLNEEDAEWVEPGTPTALAAGIRRIAATPARAEAMGARLREKARQYTWSARGSRLAQLMQPLLRAR
jgi:glycosyltransferase involved in cell wall biosynthesis